MSTKEFAKWKQRNGVEAGQKVFIVGERQDKGGHGRADLVQALVDRGWHENEDENKKSVHFDLLWSWLFKDDRQESMRANQYVNHFSFNGKLTTKDGLCSSLRDMIWAECVDADSFFPRCYDLKETEQLQEFIDDFRSLAAKRLLTECIMRLEGETLGPLSDEGDTNDASEEKSKDGDSAGDDAIKFGPELVVNKAVFGAVMSVCRKRLAEMDYADEYHDGDLLLDSPSTFVSRSSKSDSIPGLVTDLEWALIDGLDLFKEGELELPTAPSTNRSMNENNGSFLSRKQLKKWQAAQDDAKVCVHPSQADDTSGGDAVCEAREILAGLQKLDRQTQCNGERMRNVWIVKPSKQSRGRGIKMFNGSSLREMLDYAEVGERGGSYTAVNWVAQKYLENPMLIAKRKFDIRQWVMVTSWNPLTVWFFDDCYLRFCVEQYTTDDIDDVYGHLTNNSIQKYGKDFDSTYATAGGRAIRENMWDSDSFGEYLKHDVEMEAHNTARAAARARARGGGGGRGGGGKGEGEGGGEGARDEDQDQEEHVTDPWRQLVQPQMKRIVTSIMKCVQPTLVEQKSKSANSFELWGIDFMVDDEYRPWLIEVNCSPACDYSTGITEAMVKAALSDMVKVVVDVPEQQKCALHKVKGAWSLSTPPSPIPSAEDAADTDADADVGADGAAAPAAAESEHAPTAAVAAVPLDDPTPDPDPGFMPHDGSSSSSNSNSNSGGGGREEEHGKKRRRWFAAHDTGKWLCIHHGATLPPPPRQNLTRVGDLEVRGVAAETPLSYQRMLAKQKQEEEARERELERERALRDSSGGKMGLLCRPTRAMEMREKDGMRRKLERAIADSKSNKSDSNSNSNSSPPVAPVALSPSSTAFQAAAAGIAGAVARSQQKKREEREREKERTRYHSRVPAKSLTARTRGGSRTRNLKVPSGSDNGEGKAKGKAESKDKGRSSSIVLAVSGSSSSASTIPLENSMPPCSPIATSPIRVKSTPSAISSARSASGGPRAGTSEESELGASTDDGDGDEYASSSSSASADQKQEQQQQQEDRDRQQEQEQEQEARTQAHSSAGSPSRPQFLPQHTLVPRPVAVDSNSDSNAHPPPLAPYEFPVVLSQNTPLRLQHEGPAAQQQQQHQQQQQQQLYTQQYQEYQHQHQHQQQPLYLHQQQQPQQQHQQYYQQQYQQQQYQQLQQFQQHQQFQHQHQQQYHQQPRERRRQRRPQVRNARHEITVHRQQQKQLQTVERSSHRRTSQAGYLAPTTFSLEANSSGDFTLLGTSIGGNRAMAPHAQRKYSGLQRSDGGGSGLILTGSGCWPSSSMRVDDNSRRNQNASHSIGVDGRFSVRK